MNVEDVPLHPGIPYSVKPHLRATQPHVHPPNSRALLQQSNPISDGNAEAAYDVIDDVTVVRTAQALRLAVSRGAAHIEIRAHLDLTHLVPKDGSGDGSAFAQYLLGTIPYTVQSIWVWPFVL